MDTIYLYVGYAAIALGVADLAITVVRAVRRSIPGWKVTEHVSGAAGFLVLGLYFVLEMNLLIPLWASLMIGSVVYGSRERRRASERVGDGVAR